MATRTLFDARMSTRQIHTESSPLNCGDECQFPGDWYNLRACSEDDKARAGTREDS